MKKEVFVMFMVAATSMAGDLGNPTKMMAAADAAVGSAPTPPLVKATPDAGVAVVPTVGGAMVASDLGTTAESIGKVGIWQTIKNIPSSYPKSTTALVALAAAVPVIANNPKLLGLDKKDSTSLSTQQANGNSATDQSLHVTVNGNGNTVQVYSNRNSDTFRCNF